MLEGIPVLKLLMQGYSLLLNIPNTTGFFQDILGTTLGTKGTTSALRINCLHREAYWQRRRYCKLLFKALRIVIFVPAFWMSCKISRTGYLLLERDGSFAMLAM